MLWDISPSKTFARFINGCGNPFCRTVYVQDIGIPHCGTVESSVGISRADDATLWDNPVLSMPGEKPPYLN